VSDVEREEWRAWREQQIRLAEERQLEFFRQREISERAERSEAERQAAITRAERQQKLNEELRERTSRQNRDKTLTGLLDHAIEQRRFRQGTLTAAKFANQRQRLSSALDNAIALKYPPPAREPTVVVVEQDDGSADFGSRNFDVAKWAKKPRSWWR
jgi:hypothetical protein